MNTIFKMIIGLAATFIVSSNLAAQPSTTQAKHLNFASIETYNMMVSYHQTSHLIFPAAIRYVDLGSECIVAGKAEHAENVLRVKASVRDFPEASNFSVITDDGRFYSFNVVYHKNPTTLNYDLLKLQQQSNRENSSVVLFPELGNNTPSLTGLLMDALYTRNKRNIKHLWTENYRIRFLLKGIHVHNGLLYLHTELRNKSNIPFNTDFISFKIVDVKAAKRTVLQERKLQPIRLYKPLTEVAGKTTDQNIFLMDAFTLGNNKMLVIEIFEKNGNRQQVIKVRNADLVYAKLIKNMDLRIE